LEEINPNEKLISEITEVLPLLDVSIFVLFEEVKKTYSQWKLKIKAKSDLANDARNFLYQFLGVLNKYRIPKSQWKPETKFPEKSWPKMINKIAKKGARYNRLFLLQKTVYEKMLSDLSAILKNRYNVSESDMESIFKRYIEHISTILNLLDEKIYSPTST